MRIAILMLVHNNEQQVQRLINHLSNDFDIYIHIDKRSKLKINKYLNVFFYKKYKTYWGSYNLVLATLYLLRKAFKNIYDRYILISGQDLPIKTNNEIIKYFQNNNTEYINIRKIPTSDGWPTMDRLTAYTLDNKNICRIKRKLLYIINKYFPRKLEYDFYGGSQWTNYTHNCVKRIFDYLKNDKKYILRFFWTSCADEIFFQTIIAKSYERENEKIQNADLRYIDWHSGPEYPKILRKEDFEKITYSNALFARKFDENVDKEIIDKIYMKIGELRNC